MQLPLIQHDPDLNRLSAWKQQGISHGEPKSDHSTTHNISMQVEDSDAVRA